MFWHNRRPPYGTKLDGFGTPTEINSSSPPDGLFFNAWSPQHFRATLQGYFLPASLAGLWGYRLAGLWTPAVSRFYLLSLPFVILATFIGRVINRRIGAHRFVLYVHCGLIAIGLVLLSQAIMV